MKLSVNLNKVALLRNSRGGGVPDINYFANYVLDQACIGITVHPRPDARHIDYNDISGHLIKTITKIDLKLLKKLRKNSLITYKKYSQKIFENKIDNLII